MDIKSYIEDLFKYLETYENRYTEFETEAFLQTYNGIYAVFQAMREKRDRAVGVDQFFLEKIRQVPLTSSDLRQLVIQILITYFESEADIDGQSNKSYMYCRELRPVKRDISYFESHLVPVLFREGSLNNNFQLSYFIMKEIARYINKFSTDIKANGLTPEDFAALSDPMKFVELMRRRMILGENLLSDRTSLEFHLHGIDAFNKLGKKNKLHEEYLTEWNYLRKTSFWTRLKTALGVLGGKISGAFASGRYFRLVMTQRPMAYLFYGIIIILFIFLAIYVPSSWGKYTEHRLEEFQKKADVVRSGAGR